MAEKRRTLKPGELPNVYDTDPPELHEATVIREGYVGIDEAKLTKAEREEVLHRYPAPNIYHAPKHEPSPQPEHAHERDTAPAARAAAGTRSAANTRTG